MKIKIYPNNVIFNKFYQSSAEKKNIDEFINKYKLEKTRYSLENALKDSYKEMFFGKSNANESANTYFVFDNKIYVNNFNFELVVGKNYKMKSNSEMLDDKIFTIQNMNNIYNEKGEIELTDKSEICFINHYFTIYDKFSFQLFGDYVGEITPEFV